jgi:fucose 4-O-acetylase-like acetyltransferase
MIKKRIEWVDVSKVLVIWLMVLGHILEKSGIDSVARNMIYSFHMPFFFFVSGFLYNAKSNNFRQFTIANVKSLLIPYVFLRLCSFTVLIPYILFTSLDVSNYLIEFIDGRGNSPGGASWFLLCFFCVKELYYWIDKQNARFKWAIIVLLAFVSYILPNRLFWNLDGAFMAIPFFFIGSQYKQLSSKIMSESFLGNKAIVLFLFFMVFVSSCYQGTVSIYDSNFGNFPMLFYPVAFTGIAAVLLFSYQMRSNHYFEVCSKGTIVIMGLHGAIYPYLMLVYRVLVRPSLSAPINLLCEIAISIIVLVLLYYPILWLQKYLPFFIGNRC